MQFKGDAHHKNKSGRCRFTALQLAPALTASYTLKILQELLYWCACQSCADAEADVNVEAWLLLHYLNYTINLYLYSKSEYFAESVPIIVQEAQLM